MELLLNQHGRPVDDVSLAAMAGFASHWRHSFRHARFFTANLAEAERDATNFFVNGIPLSDALDYCPRSFFRRLP
jgi:hypothetical protein